MPPCRLVWCVDMKFGSLFSGIGGFDLALERAGWECAWQCEIDKKASDILARHWPETPRYDDITKLDGRGLAPVDLICGGFPCQDLSVAGNRAGLAGERSGLWHEFRRIIAEVAPRWVLVENVPGLLSSNKGRDLNVILQGLEELGYGWAYRVLDAQYFGVAQRRRRVFIVGHLGEPWSAPGEVLFESESCNRDTPPQRVAGQDVTTYIIKGSAIGRKPSAGPQRGEVLGGGTTYEPHAIYVPPVGRAPLSHGGNDKQDPTMMTYVATWDERSVTSAVNRTRVEYGNPANTLHTGSLSLIGTSGVRRLTPLEGERLQGFPDGWTAEQSDPSRNRQLGNAVCVPVVEWIGRGILATSPAMELVGRKAATSMPTTEFDVIVADPPWRPSFDLATPAQTSM